MRVTPLPVSSKYLTSSVLPNWEWTWTWPSTSSSGSSGASRRWNDRSRRARTNVRRASGARCACFYNSSWPCLVNREKELQVFSLIQRGSANHVQNPSLSLGNFLLLFWLLISLLSGKEKQHKKQKGLSAQFTNENPRCDCQIRTCNWCFTRSTTSVFTSALLPIYLRMFIIT